MKKRILTFVLVAVICLGLAVPALAVEIVDSGKCGDNLTWTLDSAGTLTISGTGDMWDFVELSGNELTGGVPPWNADGLLNKGRGIRAVEIKSGVTSIGQGAFLLHTNLSYISIPDTVTAIGLGAFYRCEALTSISIPGGVKSIGAGAFQKCGNLVDVFLAEGITNIEKYAFADCGLTGLDIPGSVTEIGEGMLAGCYQLTHISVAPGNTRYTVTDGVLYDKVKQEIICYPAQLEKSSYVIPDGTVSIRECAFLGCENLAEVAVPDSVKKIGQSAFTECTSLKSIVIPRGVTSIEPFTFRDCRNLALVTISDGVAAIGERAFLGCTNLTNVTIPDSVASIGEFAFADCDSLTEMTIPKNVTAMADGVFAMCDRLTDIFVDAENTQYTALNGVVYNKGLTELVQYPTGRNDGSFSIPKGVITVGADAFYCCTGLTSIIIPDGVAAIEDHAFYGCENLNRVEIPASVTRIGDSAFYMFYMAYETDTAIKDVYYGSTEASWKAIDVGELNDSLTSANIHYGDLSPSSVLPVFTDVSPDAYYAAPVTWAVKKEITSGTSATAFSPNQDCTNAQILTFLWRACGKPAPEIKNPFTNNIPNAYLQAAVWAYEQGMVSGSTFHTNQPCTRAMAVTYIWKAAGSPAASGNGFADVPDGADYAQAVAWAVENGVTAGTSDYAFSPDNVCSRGQIVTFLYRAAAEK